MFILYPTLLGFSILFIFEYLAKKNDPFDDHDNTTPLTLFIGDSHIETSINDSLMESWYNLASSSESYYFSYYKIRQVIQTRLPIRRIYLGIGYHSFSNYQDVFISGEYSSSVAPKYMPFLPIKERIRILGWNREKFLSFYKKGLAEYVKATFTKKKIWGGYSNHFRNTTISSGVIDSRILEQFYSQPNNSIRAFSDLNIEYLIRIVDLCSKNDIELVLLSTPIHQNYYKKIPEEYIEYYNDLVPSLPRIIDLSNMMLSDDCFAPDGDHVSMMGVKNVMDRISAFQ